VVHFTQELDKQFLDLTTAILDGQTDDKTCLDQQRQLAAVRKMVKRVFAYPQERVKSLRRGESEREAPTGSRRGRGL